MGTYGAPDRSSRNGTRTCKEEFYRECAVVIGAAHALTAWAGGLDRHAGKERFRGFGITRLFGPKLVQVSLRGPVAFRATSRSTDEPLAALRELCGKPGRLL